MGTYQPPSVLRRWTVDLPDDALHELTILANDQVCMTSGLFAHSSGAIGSTWSEFLGGTMNALVAERLGKAVLEEARMFITNYRAA